MLFSPDPTKQAVELTSPRKKKPRDHPPILFNDTPISKIEVHMHLGLILESKFSFNSHAKTVVSKCRRGIGMIKYVSNYLPRHTLNDLYTLYVRPRLDYGDAHLLHTSREVRILGKFKFDHLMEKLEFVQYSAALAITVACKGTSLEKLYNGLDGNHLT